MCCSHCLFASSPTSPAPAEEGGQPGPHTQDLRAYVTKTCFRRNLGKIRLNQRVRRYNVLDSAKGETKVHVLLTLSVRVEPNFSSSSRRRRAARTTHTRSRIQGGSIRIRKPTYSYSQSVERKRFGGVSKRFSDTNRQSDIMSSFIPMKDSIGSF